MHQKVWRTDTCTGTQPETNMLPLLLRSWGHNEFSHTIVKGKEHKVYVTFRPITTSYHTGVSMKEYFVFLCQSLIYVRAQTPHTCPYVPINVFKQCFHWLWNLPFDWNVIHSLQSECFAIQIGHQSKRCIKCIISLWLFARGSWMFVTISIILKLS